MASWMTLSWAPERPWSWPRRLAGTMKQYSKKAIAQLTSTTFQSAACLCLRWPYQAKVMKTLEMVSRMAVFMGGMYKSVIGNEGTLHEWKRAVDQRRRGGGEKCGSPEGFGSTPGVFSE